MNGGRSRRGEPVLALALLIGGWCGVRGLVLAGENGAFTNQPIDLASKAIASANRPSPVIARQTIVASTAPTTTVPRDAEPLMGPASERTKLQEALLASASRASRSIEAERQAVEHAGSPPDLPFSPPPTTTQAVPPPVRVVAGHQMLWLAAVGRLPMPMLATRSAASAVNTPMPPRRWSADSWLLLRKGATGLSPAGRSASYGASQLGAVLRYRLMPGSPSRPAAYLRASAALDGSREKEAALGLSVRPLPRLPVIAAVEGRLFAAPGVQQVRPALMVVTELAPVKLPLSGRAEIYAQAGYVGGRNATGFVDAQLRIDRQVAKFDLGELRAGGGAWLGGQKGASRLDVGPGVTLGGSLDHSAAMRLSLDWRFRVTGQASPTSGPALTLSAGF